MSIHKHNQHNQHNQRVLVVGEMVAIIRNAILSERSCKSCKVLDEAGEREHIDEEELVLEGDLLTFKTGKKIKRRKR